MTFNYDADGNINLGGISIGLSNYYSHNSQGGMRASRCGTIIFYFPKKVVVLNFIEGERAWLKYEAKKGKIKSIWINRIRIIVNEKTQGLPVILYYDNLNAIFNKEDLITNSEAVNIALAYHQKRLLEAQKALNCL